MIHAFHSLVFSVCFVSIIGQANLSLCTECKYATLWWSTIS